MKKTTIYVALALLFSLSWSCSEEKLIDEVFVTVERGLVLRTVSTPNPTFDFFDPSAPWTVTLEAQDEEDGNLFSQVKVYITFLDDGVASSEVLATTVDASAFAVGPFGFPRGNVSLTLAEAIGALGLQSGDYDSSDSFNVRLVGVLSDGREYTNNANGTVTGGSFFSSPFAYSIQFFCPLEDASPFNGSYTVTSDGWADYDGGEVVQAQYLGTDGNYTFRLPNDIRPFIVNGASTYLIVTIDPTDGSVTVSSNEPWDYGGGDIFTVTGDGSVGTCTGDINLSLDFSGSSQDQAFTLTKN
jgi:hypothetical protein